MKNKTRTKLRENKRIYYQKRLHKNAKNNFCSFFITMKTLSGKTRKEHKELSENRLKMLKITSQLLENFDRIN